MAERGRWRKEEMSQLGNSQEKIDTIIREAREKKASDIHLSEGMPVWYRVNGRLIQAETQIPSEEMAEMLTDILSERQRKLFDTGKDADFAIRTSDGHRQRVNVFRQQKKMAATIRLLNAHIPTLEELKMPTLLYQLAEEPRGLILVTGPTGSGKSTTLAAMIEHMNQVSDRHIITIEDPVEYVYENKKSLIHQREVGEDVESFAAALRSALHEDPDVILVGEMRDYETIDVAMTAAETGHLVFSTLHTIGAANTVDRIIDVFPANQQRQIAVQLSMVLQAVISQQLVPTVDGKQVPVFEVMTITPAIRNMIRDNKVPQIDGIVYSSNKEEMHSMDFGLLNLYKEGRITAETALSYASNPEMLKKKL